LTIFVQKQAQIFVNLNAMWKYNVAELRFSSVCEVTDYILWTTRF